METETLTCKHGGTYRLIRETTDRTGKRMFVVQMHLGFQRLDGEVVGPHHPEATPKWGPETKMYPGQFRT